MTCHEISKFPCAMCLLFIRICSTCESYCCHFVKLVKFPSCFVGTTLFVSLNMFGKISLLGINNIFCLYVFLVSCEMQLSFCVSNHQHYCLIIWPLSFRGVKQLEINNWRSPLLACYFVRYDFVRYGFQSLSCKIQLHENSIRKLDLFLFFFCGLGREHTFIAPGLFVCCVIPYGMN